MRATRPASSGKPTGSVLAAISSASALARLSAKWNRSNEPCKENPMSRAYRIKVKETARHVLRASDHVSTQLELLEVLPPERMRELLANELQKRGFTQQGEKLIRREKDSVAIEVDPATATVTVKIETEKEVTIEGERQGWSNTGSGKEHNNDRDNLRKGLL